MKWEIIMCVSTRGVVSCVSENIRLTVHNERYLSMSDRTYIDKYLALYVESDW